MPVAVVVVYFKVLFLHMSGTEENYDSLESEWLFSSRSFENDSSTAKHWHVFGSSCVRC